jgi:alpha-tubulin suppressor-like RCC1 family protein
VNQRAGGGSGFAVRLLVTAAILVPALVLQPRRPMWQTFLIAFGAFAVGRIVEWIVVGLPTRTGERRRAPIWVTWALLGAGLVVAAAIALAMDRRSAHVERPLPPRADELPEDPAVPPPEQRAGTWRAISIDDRSACGVAADGRVRCWGQASVLGQGAGATLAGPTEVPHLTDVTAVSAGLGHGCAIDRAGAAWCWGWNFDGSVGVTPTGSYDTRLEPVRVELGGPVVAISAGTSHTCALGGDGEVWCWGSNRHGALGTAAATDGTLPPMRVEGVTGVRAIDVGRDASCAVTTDDRLMCWGDLAISGSSGSAQPSPTPREIMTGVSSVAVGESQACAMTRDGAVWCWGWWAHTSSGRHVDYRTLRQRSELTDVRAIEVGHQHACAVLANGMVRCWGSNYQGQLGDRRIVDVGSAESPTAAPPVLQLPPVVAVAAGQLETCGLTATSELWCWGRERPHDPYAR